MHKNAPRICKSMNEFHALMLTPWLMHECKIMYENKMLLSNSSTNNFIRWILIFKYTIVGVAVSNFEWSYVCVSRNVTIECITIDNIQR